MTNGNHPRVKVSPTQTVELVWDDGPYAGMWVLCARQMSVGAYFASVKENVASFMLRFADDVMQDWNLDSEAGEPLSPDASGMEKIGLDRATAILDRWMEEVIGLTAPLAASSQSGATASRPRRARRSGSRSN